MPAQCTNKNCQSTDVVMCSVALDQGTASVEVSSNTQLSGTDGITRTGSTTHKFTTQTNFAQKAAPPSPPPLLAGLVAIGFSAVFGLLPYLYDPSVKRSYLILMSVPAVIGVAIVAYALKTRPQYERDLGVWRKSWICRRCSEKFVY